MWPVAWQAVVEQMKDRCKCVCQCKHIATHEPDSARGVQLCDECFTDWNADTWWD